MSATPQPARITAEPRVLRRGNIRLVFAAGLDFLLLSFIVCAPGTTLFVMSRRGAEPACFSPVESVICVIAVAWAIAGIAVLATGAITI